MSRCCISIGFGEKRNQIISNFSSRMPFPLFLDDHLQFCQLTIRHKRFNPTHSNATSVICSLWWLQHFNKFFWCRFCMPNEYEAFVSYTKNKIWQIVCIFWQNGLVFQVFTLPTKAPRPRPKSTLTTSPHPVQASPIWSHQKDEMESKPRPNFDVNRTGRMLKPYAETLACHHQGTLDPQVAILKKIFYTHTYLFISLENPRLTLRVGYASLTPHCLWRHRRYFNLNYLYPCSHSP